MGFDHFARWAGRGHEVDSDGAGRVPRHGTRSGGRRIHAASVWAALALAACSTPRAFVWVDDLPRDRRTDGSSYRISPGDVIAITVFNQDGISIPKARVREDGKISMMFLQDVDVDGMTTNELASSLEVRLKQYIVKPVVTVGVVEMAPVRVSVVGEVTRQGTYDLSRSAGVLDALAAAGGVTDFAKRNEIFVLRPTALADGKPGAGRIRFKYDALAAGEGKAAGFKLRTGDVVVVE